MDLVSRETIETIKNYLEQGSGKAFCSEQATEKELCSEKRVLDFL